MNIIIRQRHLLACRQRQCHLQIWVAVMGLDLRKRRALRSGTAQLAGADLKSLLADPFVMHIAGASCKPVLCNRVCKVHSFRYISSHSELVQECPVVQLAPST